MSVIEHNFGIEKRLAARRFRTLLKLDALHEANVRANPIPYIERASEQIDQLERVLFEAAQAAACPSTEAAPAEMIRVNRAEYQRLLACRAIVANGFAKLVADDPET